MRYQALACDYDGTIAERGVVAPSTRAALARLRSSGRRVVLVTGRILADLERVCPDWSSIFDAIVAENGAVYLRPPAREPRLLGPAPPVALIERLRAAGVTPLVPGQVILATSQPFEVQVMDAIRVLGLELQVIFNKGAVMVLPSGINKASGLGVALADLGLSPHDVVGIGDAENDHAFLARCGLSVAVADALPSLQAEADVVTRGGAGAGAVEIVEGLLADDAALAPRPGRGEIAIGTRADGGPLAVPGRGGGILCAGMSGGGKSTIVTAFLERLAEQGRQYCVIDPEGDYEGTTAGSDDPAVGLGAAHRVPTEDEVVAALSAPDRNVIVNLLGLSIDDRPRFCATLLSRLVELRARFGRPHWIVVDEAHHVFPRDWQATNAATPDAFTGLLLVTVHPGHVAPAVLADVSLVLAVGRDPAETLREAAGALSAPPVGVEKVDLQPGEALAWRPRDGGAPARVRMFPPRIEHKRHVRKYAEGELGEDKSFYFRGPDGVLNLRAQNLRLFLQVGDGVDDGTWEHHLRQHDYSRWIRTALKDEELADDVLRVEDEASQLSAGASRARVRAAVEARYTAAS